MAEEQRFREIYALIWKANEPDSSFTQEEFESRFPRLMIWLKELHSQDKLAACGGGGFADHAGGLTLINAENIEEAGELSKGSPMNEIGTTEIMVWDVFYANIVELKQEQKLN